MQGESETMVEAPSPQAASPSRIRQVLTGLPMQMVMLALASRVLLFALAWHVSRMIPPQEDLGSPKALNVWGNWDTWHYVTIGIWGYDRSPDGVNAAFFPVFPMMLAGVKRVFGAHLEPSDYRWVAVLISIAFMLAATWALTVLFTQLTSEKVAALGVTLFLFSPFSFFLSTGYTDSILIFLIATVFIAAGKEKWILAAILVAVATATRVTGVFLIPALLLMAWNAGVGRRMLAVITAISPLGLISYMLWQWINLGNPFQFYIVQSHWGGFQDRTGQYIRGFLSSPIGWTIENVNAPTLLINMGVCVLWWATLWPMYKRFRLEFFIFNAIIILQSSLFILSQGRYLLAAIGAFITLAVVVEERPNWPILKYGLLTGFALTFTTLALLFANGQWVI